jgi:hypothetical protein
MTTAGFYDTPSNQYKILILLGIDAPNPSPATALDLMLDQIKTSSSTKLSTPKSYSPGSMGGYMKCSSGQQATPAGNVSLDVCGISDTHGIILTIWGDRSVASAASATRALRPTFEHP